MNLCQSRCMHVDLPESAEVRVASQPRTTFPVRPPSMNTMQHAEVLKNAFSACEIDLEAAVASCGDVTHNYDYNHIEIKVQCVP